MYIQINNQTYTLTRRRVTSQSITYYGLESEPTDISGAITMCRDDGFVMSEDNVGDYLRHTWTAPTYDEDGDMVSYGILTLTNIPEPEPVPEPEPGPYVPTDHDVLNALLGIDGG